MPVTGSKIESRFSIVDESFSPSSGRGSALFVNIGCDGFFFTVLDLARNKFVVLQAFPFSDVFSLAVAETRIKELVGESEILSDTTFKSVYVTAVHPVSTLVPVALFEEKERQKYFQLNHILKPDDKLFTDIVRSADAVNIYSLPASFEKTVFELFPSSSLYHFSSSLMEGVLSQYCTVEDKKMIVHVGTNHFEVIVVKGKSLLFYNTFRIQTTEDFIYHILFTGEQLGMDLSAAELILLGEVEKNSALFETAFKYIKEVKFGKRPEPFQYSYGLNDIPSHCYYNLFSQALCV